MLAVIITETSIEPACIRHDDGPEFTAGALTDGRVLGDDAGCIRRDLNLRRETDTIRDSPPIGNASPFSDRTNRHAHEEVNDGPATSESS